MKEILRNYMRAYTDLPEETLSEILELIPLITYPKGSILINQGDVPHECFFVLKGCVRQYFIDEDGNETTYQFYTEEESVTLFTQQRDDPASKFTIACVEDSTLVVGNLAEEQDMYDAYPFLAALTRDMIEKSFGDFHEAFADFVASTPEQRYLNLCDKKPTLIDRVPQHQLASYLGITPESLSRIKKRVEGSHLKLVK